jgi:O-antigen/teichoic acid export membrane protein
MTAVKKVTKNSIYLIIANISNKLILFVLFMLMVRYLGETLFGKYSFAVTFVGLFAILSDLSMGNLISREVIKDKEHLSKYFFNVLIIKVVLSLIAFMMIAATINMTDYPWDTKLAVYILGIYVLFNTALISFITPIFRAFENMEYEAFTSISQNIVTLLLGALVIYLNLGFIPLMAVFTIGSLLGFALGTSLIIMRYRVKMTGLDLNFSIGFVRSLSPFALDAVMVTLYSSIDRLLLSVMKGDAEVGYYSGVRTLVCVFLILPGAFNGAIFPMMVRSFNKDPAIFRVLYKKSFKYLFMLALPIAVGTTILASGIVVLLLGQNFAASAIILQVLIWSLIFMFMNTVTGNVFCAIDKQMVGSLLAGALVVINLSLNLLLIPYIGGIGAAIAAVCTEGIGFAYAYYYFSKRLQIIPLQGAILKPCIASAIMGACVFMLMMAGVNVLLIIITGAIVYALAILLIKGLESDDIELIEQVIGKDNIKKIPFMTGALRDMAR